MPKNAQQCWAVSTLVKDLVDAVLTAVFMYLAKKNAAARSSAVTGNSFSSSSNEIFNLQT